MNIFWGFYAAVHVAIWSVATFRCVRKCQWLSATVGAFFVGASVMLAVAAFLGVL